MTGASPAAFEDEYVPWDQDQGWKDMSVEMAFLGNDIETGAPTRIFPVYRLNLGERTRRRLDWMIQVSGFPGGSIEHRKMRVKDVMLDLTEFALTNPQAVHDIAEAVHDSTVGGAGLVMVRSVNTNRLYVVTKSSWTAYLRKREK